MKNWFSTFRDFVVLSLISTLQKVKNSSLVNSKHSTKDQSYSRTNYHISLLLKKAGTAVMPVIAGYAKNAKWDANRSTSYNHISKLLLTPPCFGNTLKSKEIYRISELPLKNVRSVPTLKIIS